MMMIQMKMYTGQGPEGSQVRELLSLWSCGVHLPEMYVCTNLEAF